MMQPETLHASESILRVNIGALHKPDGGCLLNDITFGIGTGERLAIIGPNGSGKT